MLYEVINHYGEPYRPYMGEFVNHLPMVQLALYQMTGDLDRVKNYSEFFTNHFDIDPTQPSYPKMNTIETCVGKRELYESCLELVAKEIASQGVIQMIKYTLNNYVLGISSGLFHVLIRLGFAAQGYRMEPESNQEVERAIAYYLTAYKQADKFHRKVEPSRFVEEMQDLINSLPIQKIANAKRSMGQTLKALYSTEQYMQIGFVVQGTEVDKVRGLLAYLMPLFNQTHDIVILHCITGLHALTMLKDYFNDFDNALDVLTTCITTHILAVGAKKRFHREHDAEKYAWDEVLRKGSQSQDVHTIKLVYSCHELYKTYRLSGLKEVALNRLG